MPTNPATWERYWPEFRDRMRNRLEAGAIEYGDASFTRPARLLSNEIEEELLDVVGWAFMLWVRVRKMEPLLRLTPHHLETLTRACEYLNEDLARHGVEGYRVDLGKLATALEKD